jgi:16S rRNA (cytosine967-C5)-methyltransferase
MTLDSLLSHTSEIVRIMRKRTQPADAVMSEYLRTRKYIGASDRRFISSLAFHTLRILSIAEAWEKKNNSADVVRAAYEVSNATIPEPLNSAASPLPEPRDLHASPTYPRDLRVSPLPEPLSIRRASIGFEEWLQELPVEVQVCTQRWLLEETRRRWQDDAEKVWQAMMQAAPVCLRVNARRATRDAVIAQLRSEDIECEPGLHAPYAIILKRRSNLLQHELYKKGVVEIQDEGSQLISLACNVVPGMRVLDACAGAGGKTLHLADIMKGEGIIVARDIEWMRLKEIYHRARRAGIQNVKVETTSRRPVPSNSHRVNAKHEELFNVVLADVPCSGMGTVRRMPMPKWRLTPAQLQKLVRNQITILSENAENVMEGGSLVYATCSILPAENEDVVQQFLTTHPTFKVEFEQQFDPYHHGTDGLYVCRMLRSA